MYYFIYDVRETGMATLNCDSYACSTSHAYLYTWSGGRIETRPADQVTPTKNDVIVTQPRMPDVEMPARPPMDELPVIEPTPQQKRRESVVELMWFMAADRPEFFNGEGADPDLMPDGEAIERMTERYDDRYIPDAFRRYGLESLGG